MRNGQVFPVSRPANEMAAEPLSHPRHAFVPVSEREELAMPQGDKSAYTDKQKRKAAHIEESYKEQGLSEDEAESRAWATVNKQDGGGKKSGSGRARRKGATHH